MRLNWDRPYGHVYGLPGVVYEQNGVHFNLHGEAIGAPPPQPPPIPEPVDVKIRKDGLGPDDLRRPENRALKAQLAQYGEVWTTAEHAREFLATVNRA